MPPCWSAAICSLAEDIVQAAFLRAYERIAQFDPARPFGPWFLRSVVNDALMAVTRRRQVSLDQAGPEFNRLLSPASDVAARLEAAETKEAVWAAVEQLAPGQRAAVVLRYYLDLSDTEIAATLAVPPGTVRRRLQNAGTACAICSRPGCAPLERTNPMPTRLIHDALEEDADRRMAPHPDLWPAIRRRIPRRQPLHYLRWALVPTAILLLLAGIVLALAPWLAGSPAATDPPPSPSPAAPTRAPAGTPTTDGPPRMTLAAFKTLYDDPATRPADP